MINKRLKGLLILVSVLWFLVTLTSCSPRIKNIDSEGKNIICFGDSLTSGVGASQGNDYPAILARKLNFKVINAGNPGDTTAGALNRIKADILDKDPLMVIVILGGNDFLRGVPYREVYRNLEEIVKIIQDKGAIVVLGQVNFSFFMSHYSRMYRDIARRQNAVLVPNLLSGIIDNPDFKFDNIHPNDKGYEVMAERVLKVIRPVLKRNLKERKIMVF